MNWIYFLLIGWWLGPLWFVIGLLISFTIIGWTAGMAMIHRTPEMMFGSG